MKIVRRGVIPVEKTAKATCGNCKSVLEEKAGNLTWVAPANWRDVTHALEQCPVCQAQITFYYPKD